MQMFHTSQDDLSSYITPLILGLVWQGQDYRVIMVKFSITLCKQVYWKGFIYHRIISLCEYETHLDLGSIGLKVKVAGVIGIKFNVTLCIDIIMWTNYFKGFIFHRKIDLHEMKPLISFWCSKFKITKVVEIKLNSTLSLNLLSNEPCIYIQSALFHKIIGLYE